MTDNPWHRPPPATEADESEDVTYAAVGRALTHWEQIESELSHLFAIFIDKFSETEAYDLYYKNGRSTMERIATLENAAERYFQKHPSQEIESEFSGISRAATGFASRRHEIAHGIVRPIQWYWPFVKKFMNLPPDSPYRFCLVPPHYQRGWFENAAPEYIYTSREVNLIGMCFLQFVHQILAFRRTHFPDP
jgi:hypothetical protein